MAVISFGRFFDSVSLARCAVAVAAGDGLSLIVLVLFSRSAGSNLVGRHFFRGGGGDAVDRLGNVGVGVVADVVLVGAGVARRSGRRRRGVQQRRAGRRVAGRSRRRRFGLECPDPLLVLDQQRLEAPDLVHQLLHHLGLSQKGNPPSQTVSLHSWQHPLFDIEQTRTYYSTGSNKKMTNFIIWI